MDIINGSRVNEEPIGRLMGPNGIILVYKDNLAEAYLAAVGDPPVPPALNDGGVLIPTYSAPDALGTSVVTGYTYDPGPDNVNTANIDRYKAEVDAWNNRATAVKSALDLMTGKSKPSGETK